MVVRSCVRVINLHGRYHQGVFRVSGSQHEINEFKNAFEKGQPLQLSSTTCRLNNVGAVENSIYVTRTVSKWCHWRDCRLPV